MTTLFLKDISVDKSSYIDPNGFLFSYNGEIYRAINQSKEMFYKDLFQSGLINKWVENNCLVPSEITNYTIPEINCNLVIKHKKIEPVSYCVEWCYSMHKKAAITTLDLALELLDHNCLLQDAYPWNITFAGTNPVFLDLTSIVPIDTHLLWPAYQQFLNFFVYPLEIYSMGKGNIARMMLHDYINGVTLRDLTDCYGTFYAFRYPIKTTFFFFQKKIENILQQRTHLRIKLQEMTKNPTMGMYSHELRKKFIKKLLRRVDRIKNYNKKTLWQNYYSAVDKDFVSYRKIEVVEKILSTLKPHSVLDIGCNIGRFSIISAQKGARVISLDSDESCIEELFKVAEKERYNITPLVCDIVNPTPAFGFLSSQFLPLIQRVKSDAVLCLGLMHHLHINARQSFGRIASLLNELSKKFVIFEYVDSTDGNIHILDRGRKIEYSLESVSTELSRYFKLSYFDSDRLTRKIILCEK